MLTTTKVPRDQLESYFDRFTKHFLKYDTTTAVDVEYLSQDLGDQFEAEGTHLLGVTYDPKDNAFELELENGEHRVFAPAEIWTAEDTDGFVRAIEVVHDDGTRDVIHVKRLAPRPRE